MTKKALLQPQFPQPQFPHPLLPMPPIPLFPQPFPQLLPKPPNPLPQQQKMQMISRIQIQLLLPPQLFPHMFLHLASPHILCHGGNTGSGGK